MENLDDERVRKVFELFNKATEEATTVFLKLNKQIEIFNIGIELIGTTPYWG